MKFNQLSQDLLISLLSFLDLPEVTKFFSISKAFYSKLQHPLFVECLMTQLPSLKLFNLKPPKGEILSFFRQIYKKLYLAQSSKPQYISWMPLDASSTDKSQSIYCTLPDFQGFWSSIGLNSEHQNQWLLYDLGENFTQCFLKEISIKFTHFGYVYVQGPKVGNAVFQSKYVQVELGFVPDKPVFKSEMIPVRQDVEKGEELIVTVPIAPFVVFARYVRIVFIEMSSRHTLKDNLFYMCVDEVIPKGNYCYNINEGLLRSALDNFYTEKNVSVSKESNLNAESLYIRDTNFYIEHLIRHIDSLSKDGKLEKVLEIFNASSQLKMNKMFLKYLKENIELADLYLENVEKKQMHLNFLETVLMLNLSIDWSKLDLFGESNFMKSDKYFSMFMLYYFVPEKLQKYIHDYYEVSEEEAFNNLEEDTVDDVPQLDLHWALELKKIMLKKALEQLQK